MNENQILTVARLIDVTRRDAKEAGVDWHEYAFEAAKALMAFAVTETYRVSMPGCMAASVLDRWTLERGTVDDAG